MSSCKKVKDDWKLFAARLEENAKDVIAPFSPDEIIFRARYNILDLSYSVDNETWDLLEDIELAEFIRKDLDFRNAGLEERSTRAVMVRWLYNVLYGQPETYSPLRGYDGKDPNTWLFNHEYEAIPELSDYAIKAVFKAVASRLDIFKLAALYTTCTGRRRHEWKARDLEEYTESALTKLREDESFRAEIETEISYPFSIIQS